MGKTTKPLRVLVIGLPQSVEFDELAASGHTVEYEASTEEVTLPYDLILGPRCWRMDERLLRLELLPLAIKEARGIRYPKTEREEPEP